MRCDALCFYAKHLVHDAGSIFCEILPDRAMSRQGASRKDGDLLFSSLAVMLDSTTVLCNPDSMSHRLMIASTDTKSTAVDIAQSG
jgi:hypothetical protein